MSIIIAIILIVGGLATIFYIRPKIQAHVTDKKYFRVKRYVYSNGFYWSRGSI